MAIIGQKPRNVAIIPQIRRSAVLRQVWVEPQRCMPRYSRNETLNNYQNLENSATCFQTNEAIYSAGCNLLRIFIDQLVRYGISTSSTLYALTTVYMVKAKLNAPIGNMNIR